MAFEPIPKRTPDDVKWRALAPQIMEMSAEKAIVLALHHLEMAQAMFDCIEPERHPELANVDEDIPEEWKEDIALRRTFALAALERRYPAGGAFNAAAAAFINSLIGSQNREQAEYFRRIADLPIVDVDENGQLISRKDKT